MGQGPIHSRFRRSVNPCFFTLISSIAKHKNHRYPCASSYSKIFINQYLIYFDWEAENKLAEHAYVILTTYSSSVPKKS